MLTGASGRTPGTLRERQRSPKESKVANRKLKEASGETQSEFRRNCQAGTSIVFRLLFACFLVLRLFSGCSLFVFLIVQGQRLTNMDKDNHKMVREDPKKEPK